MSAFWNCCCNRHRNNHNAELNQQSTVGLTEHEKLRMEYLENVLPIVPSLPTSSNEEGEEDEKQQCPICLMDYEIGDKLSGSHNPKCKHVFHRECIKKWLLSNNDCPCCRNDYLAFSDGEDEETPASTIINPSILSSPLTRIRQELQNRIEPIITSLEYQRQLGIDPNTNNDPQRARNQERNSIQLDSNTTDQTNSTWQEKITISFRMISEQSRMVIDNVASASQPTISRMRENIRQPNNEHNNR